MSDVDSLLIDRQGPTVILTMNRVERRNALSLDMVVRMADAWEMVDADDSIRSVILTGAGGSYCVGGDLDAGWMAGNRSAEPSPNERRVIEDPALIGRGLLLTQWLRTPLIAVVNGDCLGGGCEMLQQTDIRIAEEQARFGLPEARLGFIAGAGSTMRLKRQIPYAVAMEMLLTGRVLDADEALRWGLVTHVVPTGAGLARGREIADVIAANSPLSVAASKASVIETGWLPEEEARAIENSYSARVIRSNDAKEGLKAFAEKRPPEFTGT
ncbi:MAG: enoyl-CoA hydratase-related protein [Actinomycetota bacterium]|nr:enoyl-CoA hydratase-related protein [Actinomycetota bacterium]